jgi:beta-N-acetylhexosaminidase
MDDVRGLAGRVLLASFDGPTLPAWVRDRLEQGLGGICLYGTNIQTLQQIRDLDAAVHAARPEALTALDEEGGDVTRLYYLQGSPHAGHAVLGRVDDESLTAAVAGDIGTQLRDHGVDLDLGPVVDVNSAPDNPVIGVRSFGASPDLVARHAVAWVHGLQRAGVGACLKHFPGHGDTTVDSHLDLPSVDQPMDVLRRRELVPFAAATRAGAVAVMTSHVLVRALDPALPATMSPASTSLLRGELGFEGVLVSDALDMRGASGGRGIPAAAVLSLRAGVDLLCIGSSFTPERLDAVVDAVVAAVASGDLSHDRLADTAGRVDAASARLARLRADAVGARDAGASLDAARRALEVTRPIESMTGAQVLRLMTGSNEAVGHAPWGLPVGGGVLAGRAALDVLEEDGLPNALTPGPLVVLVRDAHRHDWVRRLLHRLRTERPDAVVVEMGWPARLDGLPEPAVRTWGAGAASAQALDELLTKGSA